MPGTHPPAPDPVIWVSWDIADGYSYPGLNCLVFWSDQGTARRELEASIREIAGAGALVWEPDRDCAVRGALSLGWWTPSVLDGHPLFRDGGVRLAPVPLRQAAFGTRETGPLMQAEPCPHCQDAAGEPTGYCARRGCEVCAQIREETEEMTCGRCGGMLSVRP